MKMHSYNSSFREKLIEHLFIGELLKYKWINQDYSLEVLKPEVDNAGYDLVLECNSVIRHVQLKTAFIGSKTARQNIHVSLANKPSGCVIWIYFDPDDLTLGPFLFFGGRPGQPMPDMSQNKIARHTKGDAEGYKAERANLRIVNKGSFNRCDTIETLCIELFG